MRELLGRLEGRFNLSDCHRQRDNLAFVIIDSKDAVALITHLRDAEGFSHLSYFTAVDHIEEGVFILNYLLHNYNLHADLCIKTPIPRENSTMRTIHHLWGQAATYERELKEMFGIDFPVAPGLTNPSLWKAGTISRPCAGSSIRKNIRKKPISRDPAGQARILPST